jgi:hypothetical protein
MTVRYGPRVVNEPRVPIQIAARSLLLVSSGIVRKCEKESMMAKIRKRMVKWGLSTAKQHYLFSGVMALSVLATVGSVAQANSIEGPSSSQSPYVVRSIPGVVTKSILTVGDSVNNKPDGTPYRLVGIPDGLGAFDNGDDTFTLLMNHELTNTVGITRAHGAKGAFISKWKVRKDDLTVLHGEDLIQNVKVWNPSTYQFDDSTAPFTRFCSADLPALSAFYNAASGLGYNGRIFMNGEESGVEGRAFAHLMNGTSYELPWLGKFSWENSVANPATGLNTVVAGTDDGTGGQVYFYVGTKTNSANPIEAAGLTNGNLFGIKVNGLDVENNETVLNGSVPFTAYNFGDVSSKTGAALETESKDASGAYRVTSFQRPEDGAWDPTNPNDFYFVTTASFTGNSRLWRAHFTNPANPTAGGTIEMLLKGSEGQKMMDNLTITKRGQILIQEDPGNQTHIAKLWLYNIENRTMKLQAQHDPERFTPGVPGFLTQDEESSGIIDASDILGEGWFLLDVQAHYNRGDAELVEGGQLMALHIPPGRK